MGFKKGDQVIVHQTDDDLEGEVVGFPDETEKVTVDITPENPHVEPQDFEKELVEKVE